MDWDEYLQQAAQCITSREKYQRILGKLSSEIAKKYEPRALKDFATAIKENSGLTVSYMTLRNYRWVWDITSPLDLPEDLAYRTLQYIASSGKPEYWAKRIKDEGLSSPEVFRLMREDKRLTNPKPKMAICPECTHEFEV